MKPLLSAIATALILFSAQGVAEQTTQPVVTSCGNVVVVPPTQGQPPVVFNKMGCGGVNSVGRGGAYFNKHAMLFVLAPTSRGLLTSHFYRFTPPQAKYIDIQPGHNEHRTEKLQTR